MNASEFVVTRQHYYYSGEYVVEIAQGGHDYSGPDQLVKEYRHEGEVFIGMTEAVTAAIAIAQAWKQDKPKHVIKIAHGCNQGMGMELSDDDQCKPVTNKSWLAHLKRFAKAFDAKLPKCARCSEVLGKDRYGNDEILPDEKFCSEHCFDRAAEDYIAQMEETVEQEDV